MMHKVAKIKLNGKDVSIDNNIVEMIQLLNQYGMKTDSCCEYDTYRQGIFILFNNEVTEEKMEKFLDEFPLFNRLVIIRKMGEDRSINPSDKRFTFVIQVDDYDTLLIGLYEKIKPGFLYVDRLFLYTYGIDDRYKNLFKDMKRLQLLRINRETIYIDLYKEIDINLILGGLYELYSEIKNLCIRIYDSYYLFNDEDELIKLTYDECIKYFENKELKEGEK